MSAVTGAARDLFRCIDKWKPLDRFVGCFVEIVRRTLERIELNVLREFLAVAGGSPVVRHEHDVARRPKKVRIPAKTEIIRPHVGGAAMDQHEQRILLRRVEVGRQRVETVDALAATVVEPEFAQRLEVDLRDAIVGEVRQRRPLAGVEVDSSHLSWMNRALPVGHYYRSGRDAGWGMRDGGSNAEASICTRVHCPNLVRLATIRRRTV